ncbi:hypothetical protein [Aurantiacibacter gilvus]|uniref:DUF4190 domain-containing protein n=1 Tax=Aurantiacibacter gilvus TaxID=3139141 RepID=A0ABU9ICA8_9SPHN
MPFSERVKAMETIDLVRIARAPESEGFEPAMVEAATAELTSRDVSESELVEIDYELDDLNTFEEYQAEKQLGPVGWVLFVVLAPVILLPLLAIAAVRGAVGYETWSRQATKATGIGIGAYFLLIGILIVADLATSR